MSPRAIRGGGGGLQLIFVHTPPRHYKFPDEDQNSQIHRIEEDSIQNKQEIRSPMPITPPLVQSSSSRHDRLINQNAEQDERRSKRMPIWKC